MNESLGAVENSRTTPMKWNGTGWYWWSFAFWSRRLITSPSLSWKSFGLLRQQRPVGLRGQLLHRTRRVVAREERVRQVRGFTDRQRIDTIKILEVIPHVRKAVHHRLHCTDSRKFRDAIG